MTSKKDTKRNERESMLIMSSPSSASVPTRFQLDNGVYCNSLKNRDGKIRAFTMGSERHTTPKGFPEIRSVRYSKKLGHTYAIGKNGFVYGLGGRFDLHAVAVNNVLTGESAMETIMYQGMHMSDQVYFWLYREQIRRHLKWYFFAKFRNIYGRRVGKKVAEIGVDMGVRYFTNRVRIQYGVNLDCIKPSETDCIMAEDSEYIGNLLKKYGCVLERDSQERKRRKLNQNY
ncbi:hypothetical protein VPHK469_0031 [Vibrio phage K469]